MTHRILPLQALTPERFAPYGWALGAGAGAPPPGLSTYTSTDSDFWREHLFSTAADGPTEVLWVAYRSNAQDIHRLEAHRLTQQALMPLNGAVVQVVACSGADGLPDLASLAAFQVLPGQGLCMAAHCWHATRVLTAVEVRCAMLTRASTTLDLLRALNSDQAPTESAFADIPHCRWQA